MRKEIKEIIAFNQPDELSELLTDSLERIFFGGIIGFVANWNKSCPEKAIPLSHVYLYLDSISSQESERKTVCICGQTTPCDCEPTSRNL
jgi:hypothetical protein